MTNYKNRLPILIIIAVIIWAGSEMITSSVKAQSTSNQLFLPTIVGGADVTAEQLIGGSNTDNSNADNEVEAAMAGGAIVGHGNNCLDIPGQNTTNGTNLQMYDCNGTVAQQWTVTIDGRITAMGKCLDVEGPYRGNGVNVQIWDCLNVGQHFWTMTSSGQIKSYDGRCLDVRGWGTANGTAVQLWSCMSPAISAQTWSVQAPPSSCNHPTLRKGDEGSDVTHAQRQLLKVGSTSQFGTPAYWISSSGGTDGDFGGGTEKAVIAYQQIVFPGQSSEHDGVIGSKTWSKLGCSANDTPEGAAPNSGIRIDWDFIQELEGNRTIGYVPTDRNGNPIGQSGVTIGSGFDLGQHDRAYMVAIGIPPQLVDILTPYTGLKGRTALNFLNRNPLVLSQEDTLTINRKVKADKAQAIINKYDSASSVKFESLARGPQTVIASVAFQYGNDLDRRTPTFWGLVTLQDWDGTVRELRNFGDDFSTRRNSEADYLQNNR